jgi:hypothetical protein
MAVPSALSPAVGLGLIVGLESVSAGSPGWQAKRNSRSRLMVRVLMCFIQDNIITVRDLVMFLILFYTDFLL